MELDLQLDEPDGSAVGHLCTVAVARQHELAPFLVVPRLAVGHAVVLAAISDHLFLQILQGQVAQVLQLYWNALLQCFQALAERHGGNFWDWAILLWERSLIGPISH